jgi:uncharacterized membrane protein
MFPKSRIEAFSDGVFAIVITLLVIELRPPGHDRDGSLAHALWDEWPSYLAYLISFLVIGVMWLNHHRLLQQVRHVDGPLLLLNLNLLLWIVLIPYPTAVVAEYLAGSDEEARTALVFYSLTEVAVALSFVALFAWITRDDRLTGVVVPRPVLRRTRLRFGVGLAVYTGAALVAL